jgi:alkylation response protein AidB-like acyl-CoA dehydrogenase
MPLFSQANMEVSLRASLLFVMDAASMLGRSESDAESSRPDEVLLRLLTPVLKLYTAKEANLVVAEGIESFGGAGYVEDTRLPVIWRDSQVLSIWEGTTNVLSHDVLRVLQGL